LQEAYAAAIGPILGARVLLLKPEWVFVE